ncbi:MAG: hypothetical protein KDD22_05255 [Bdellovibrionales bacterium]|nr:hypothetical protein [Bdellovibrionales bacterium]
MLTKITIRMQEIVNSRFLAAMESAEDYQQVINFANGVRDILMKAQFSRTELEKYKPPLSEPGEAPHPCPITEFEILEDIENHFHPLTGHITQLHLSQFGPSAKKTPKTELFFVLHDELLKMIHQNWKSFLNGKAPDHRYEATSPSITITRPEKPTKAKKSSSIFIPVPTLAKDPPAKTSSYTTTEVPFPKELTYADGSSNRLHSTLMVLGRAIGIVVLIIAGAHFNGLGRFDATKFLPTFWRGRLPETYTDRLLNINHYYDRVTKTQTYKNWMKVAFQLGREHRLPIERMEMFLREEVELLHELDNLQTRQEPGFEQKMRDLENRFVLRWSKGFGSYKTLKVITDKKTEFLRKFI